MVKKAKAKLEIKDTKPQPKYNVGYLSGVVSHNDAVSIIYKHIEPLQLSKQELKQFKRDLLKASGLQSLHPSIESMLDDMIKEKQDETYHRED